MTRRFEKHIWQAGRIAFTMVLGRSTYSVAVHDSDGTRIAWTGRQWGCSLTDALAMASYTGNRDTAAGAIAYLFNRIDGCADRPGT